ncbi:MAG: hypothetical protein ABJC13_01620 [Acidobacteriota bacterium]
MIGQVPAAQELHGEIKAATVEIVRMADRIQELEGQAHTLTIQRRNLVEKTGEDAIRLKSHLQAFLGRRNPELLMLGIRPVERRKRGPSKKTIAKALAEAMAQQEAKGGEGQSVNAEA